MARVLYITGDSITLYRTRRNGASALARFSCDAAGYTELGRLLADAEPQPLSILVDLIEEEFREETLPHTLGRDRARLHSRQAGKLFRATPFRHHRCVGRQRVGRRDDQVSFSALLNRDNVEPLMAALDQAEVPVNGIYSLPIITGRLVKALAAKSGNILIVTEQPDSGLRQTFIRDGQVRFSRLAPVNDNSPADYCQILTAESHKARRYLQTLRLLPQEQGLEVYALSDSARVEALREIAGDSADVRMHAVNLAHLARLLGFRDYPDIQFSDALFAYLLSKRPVQNHYARAQHLQHWRSYQVRQGLRAATWLLAVSATTLSGMNIVDGRQLEAETRQIAGITEQVNAEYQRVRQGLPVEPVTALSMREAIQLTDQLNAHPVDLNKLFKLMGRGFSASTDLAMDTLTWFVAADPGATSLSGLQQSEIGAAVVAAPYLITKVLGHVRTFNGSYRQAHQQIESLAQWIAGQPGVVRADVLREPLNTRTDASLQGGIAMPGDTEAAEFELRIVLELGHERV